MVFLNYPTTLVSVIQPPTNKHGIPPEKRALLGSREKPKSTVGVAAVKKKCSSGGKLPETKN